MLLMVFVFALIAGGIGWLLRQRSPQPVPIDPRAQRASAPARGAYDSSYDSSNRAGGAYDSGPAYGSGRAGSRIDLADSEAETSYWVDRLGSGINALDGQGQPGNDAARQALSDAAERHTAARRQAREATSPKQFELATRTAVEGLYYVRAARTALGLDPGPEIGRDDVPQLTSARRVTLEGQEYEASPEPGARTPYYYPGGRVGNRMVPGGWYSTPWWKTALIAGAAGIGSMVLLDALFDTGPGDGGLFGVGPGGFLDGGLFGGDMDGFGF